MKTAIKTLIFLLLAGLSFGCSDDGTGAGDSPQAVVEKTVAIVLPMEEGLKEHWTRCLELYVANLDRAFKDKDTRVKLNFEFYDESSDDLEGLTDGLAARRDIYAVVGGLYSSNAAVMASRLTRVGKTFFTMATSEEFVRGYSSTGYLWAMTETDITQCEVLLAKVINYGGKSVALVVKEDDLYGQTFIDWYGFQAKELGLENHGMFVYNAGTEREATRLAAESGAEYVVCIPSEIEEMEGMIEGHLEAAPVGGQRPRLLFSDTAYGTDVLRIYGEKAEGIEGVAFGADPESGFEVSYKTYFGTTPTLGEAQLYDAVMLTGYAAWYQHLHPDASLQDALREIVTGEDINMGSWMGEDMGLVVDALERGDHPCVRGASGPLKFDTKIYTNVLSTTYYNFRVYEGRYIILDYNTSDGGNRTDATLAGWNWKASQVQDFEQGSTLTYGPHEGNVAVLVAASTGWTNYRHQADVYAIYRQLKKSGFDDDHIILIAEDDIAYNAWNPDPGVVRVVAGGENVYEDVEIDYCLSDITAQDFLAILRGQRSERLPVVLESGPADNVFLFWSGHGFPGALVWDEDTRGITGPRLRETLEQMCRENRYRKMLMMIEACYSGGVFSECEGVPGALFITAANPDETSKADNFSGELRVWMSNRFTSTFLQQITQNPAIPIRELYYRLFINTVGSHVTVYNAHNFGNIYTSDMAEFINFR